MLKECILYDNKICDGCGECSRCDLDPGKQCDNCGKCLEDYDCKCIQIDDLLVDEAFDDEKSYNWKFDKPNDDDFDNPDVLYIDDVEGLSEELERHGHSHDCGHDYDI